MSFVTVEAIFAAGALLGLPLGWWLHKSSADEADVQVMLSAVKVLEQIEERYV